MYKIFSLVSLLLITSFNTKAQFNTVLKKKEITTIQPILATTENKIVQEEQNSVKINDALYKERKSYWDTRRYLSLPIDTLKITSLYGIRKDPVNGKMKYHKGIDLSGNNDYVYSVMPGIVIKTGKNKLLGNYVKIKHGDFTSLYGHLYNILVDSKQSVEAGQPIGISGSTGKSTGEHLHFGLEYKNNYIDPKPVLDYIQKIITIIESEVSNQIQSNTGNNREEQSTENFILKRKKQDY